MKKIDRNPGAKVFWNKWKNHFLRLLHEGQECDEQIQHIWRPRDNHSNHSNQSLPIYQRRLFPMKT